MQIHKGKYRLAGRNLNFDMVDNLSFNKEGGCYFFRGGNGFGKTSFLEKVIIPALKAGNLPYLYIGQDIRTQLYTLRALLSIQGVKVAGTDEVELLRIWMNRGRSASVLMLDEFDKYFRDYGFIFDWCADFIRTYIIVSHLPVTHWVTAACNHRIYNVRFEMIGTDGPLKNIRVRSE